MLKIERQKYIEEFIQKTGSIIISDISTQLNCSEETIRRDLKELENKGVLKRTHGGAFLTDYEDKTIPSNLRNLYIPKEKDEISKIALENYIHDYDIIILDSSTTCLHLASMISKKNMKITIITNSLSIITLFENQLGNTKLIVTGGKYKTKSHSFVGPRTIDFLSSYSVPYSFISCSAIDIDFGILDNNENECEIRKAIIKHSRNRILLVDHTKFSDSGEFIISNFSNIDIVITDKKPQNTWLIFFKNHNIKILYP